MWLPGHVAVGLLLSLALVLIGLRRGERLVTLLACMAFFSVLPDFLHLEGLRAFSHSFLGAGLMLAAGAVLLTAFLGWRPWLLMVAAVSLASHLMADAFIGHIYPWYPWSLEIVQHNQFNTLFDVRVEIGLCAVAAVPLIFLLLTNNRRQPVRRRDCFANLALLGLFAAQVMAQMVYFTVLDIINTFTYSAAMLLLIFGCILLMATGSLVMEGRCYSRGIIDSFKESGGYYL